MGYLKKAFGENIKFLRKQKGLTQEKFAEMVDIDQRQLARIEAGESFATAETIERMSEKLGVSVGVLFNVGNSENDKMTLEVMERYDKNIKNLLNVIKKAALNPKKTEFLLLAAQALEHKSAREKLKGTLLGFEISKS